VLWDGQIGTLTGFGHDKVAANLADLCPAGFLEGFRGFFAEMLANVPMYAKGTVKMPQAQGVSCGNMGRLCSTAGNLLVSAGF